MSGFPFCRASSSHRDRWLNVSRLAAAGAGGRARARGSAAGGRRARAARRVGSAAHAPRNVVDEQCARGAAVVRPRDAAKRLLAGLRAGKGAGGGRVCGARRGAEPPPQRGTRAQRARARTVSQICSLMFLSSILTMRAPNSTPMVRSCTCWKRLSVNCSSRHDLPTPVSPAADGGRRFKARASGARGWGAGGVRGEARACCSCTSRPPESPPMIMYLKLRRSKSARWGRIVARRATRGSARASAAPHATRARRVARTGSGTRPSLRAPAWLPRARRSGLQRRREGRREQLDARARVFHRTCHARFALTTRINERIVERIRVSYQQVSRQSLLRR